MYSATLGLVDIVRGTNSYYKLQLLEDDVQKRCVASFSGSLKSFPVEEDQEVTLHNGTSAIAFITLGFRTKSASSTSIPSVEAHPRWSF